MATVLKIYLVLLLLNPKVNQLEMWLEVSWQLVDQNQLKLLLCEIHDCCHLENLFCTTSPEQKGQLTRNLVGSIGTTCR